MNLTQESLWKDRVIGLVLTKLYERKYQSDSGKTKAYLYELCFMAQLSENTDQINVESNTTVSTMMALSKLKFLDCELLGLIKYSLEVSETRHQSSSTDLTSRRIEIQSDNINNTIQITYFITEVSSDFEIRFKIATKSAIKINEIEKRNIKMDVHKSSFHRNGCAIGGELCNFLEMGFKIGSMENVPYIPKVKTVNMTDFLPRTFLKVGSSRKLGYSQGQSTSVVVPCPTMLVFVQYLNYPSFIIFTNSENDILFLKQMIGNTLEKLNYGEVHVDNIRLICNTKLMENDETLKELFPGFNVLQCAMVTRRPCLPSRVLQRTPPETQIAINTNQRFNSILILYRNVAACNRAAESFLPANDRLRFNDPVIRFTGVVYSEDLGELIIMISKELKKLSGNYLKLSHFMIKDENLVPGSTRRDNFKQLIQNTFDAARYAGPLFRGLSSLRIPLYLSSPREVTVIR